jgi:hypothetical protein
LSRKLLDRHRVKVELFSPVPVVPSPPSTRVPAKFTEADMDYGQGEVIVNKETHGPTYDMVMSEKKVTDDPQDPHWTGKLLPPALPDRDAPRAHEFFDGMNVLG